MYPDREYFYDEAENSEYYCQKINDKDFLNCLVNDTHASCFKKKEKAYTKCNEEKGYKHILRRHVNRSRPYYCDKSNVVYILTKESNFNKPYDECSRPFVLQKIAHSNLILLITKSLRSCAQESTIQRDFKTVPTTVEYHNSTFCRKKLNPLFRNRPTSCLTHHEKVRKFSSSSLIENSFLNSLNRNRNSIQPTRKIDRIADADIDSALTVSFSASLSFS